MHDLGLDIISGPRSNINMSIESPNITSYLMTRVTLSLITHEIFTNQIKCQMFDSENNGQGQGGKYGTCAIPLEMFNSILVIIFVF